MRTRRILIAGLLIASTALGFPVHRYPGLKNLIDRSTDVARIRINAHISGNGLTYDTYDVTFLETFKGDIPAITTQDIALANLHLPISHDITNAWFQTNEEYIVFLEPNTLTNVAGTHRNMPIIGSCWKLRPGIYRTPDKRQALHEQMESLFDSQEWEKEGTEPGACGYGSPEAGETDPQL